MLNKELYKKYSDYSLDDFTRIIVSEEEIKEIIISITSRINEDYKNKKLLVCGILKGSFIFMADIIRKITIPLECAFIKASSYHSNTVSSGNIKITEYTDFTKYTGYDILIIDDILDSGNTLHHLTGYFSERGFKNINFCVMLDKYERREKEVYVKYIGKRIENEFIVGYGLDYDEKYRYLPFIAALDEKIYKK